MLYLDHAATSATRPEVIEALARDLARPLNAGSVHQPGQRAHALLESAREEMAGLLGLPPAQVLFTSSATEANNLALRGFARAFLRRCGRIPTILTSVLEHSCIRETCRDLARDCAANIALLPVEAGGRVILPNANPDGADLLTLPAIQNETGVIQDLQATREWRLASSARWLCDITQAFHLLPIRVPDLGADFVSFASHKLGGPPGVGCLAGPGLRDIAPLLTGGPQEGELRAGTQPVALVRAFVLAAKLARKERDTLAQHLHNLEVAFLEALRNLGVVYTLNGEGAQRAPGFINISIPGLSGPDLVIALDARGFAVSSGAACATGVMETSETLAAMFPDDAGRAAGALRITPGAETLREDMIALATALKNIQSGANG